MPHSKTTHAAPHHTSTHASTHTSSHTPHTPAHAATPKAGVRTFASLNLAEPILRAVITEGYTIPTPIQAQAIPHILSGRDVLGCAQTGTGKTAAFALPMLHRLSTVDTHAPHPNQHQHRATRALILSPTRELALQIDESFRTYGRHARLRSACIFGGVNQNPQTRALRLGVDILVATPGRLMDLMQQGFVDLSHVEVFVLDEADRMLDMGFIEPIRRIASEIPKKRQTLLFSATMPGPIRHLAEALLTNPVRVEVATVASTPELVEQSVFMVPKRDKPALLAHFVREAKAPRVLVFTRTKHGADRVAKDLSRAGISADAIHGNKRQNVRQRTLAGFRAGQIRVLVATDIAARGIDVEGISHVVNFDIPHEAETYVHRIGRTARAGASGKAISFCDTTGEERSYLRHIEKLIRKPIPVLPPVENLPPAPARSAHPDDAMDERPTRGGRFGGERPRGEHSYGDRGTGRSRPAFDERPPSRSAYRAAPHRTAQRPAYGAPAAPAHGATPRSKEQHDPRPNPKPRAEGEPHAPAQAPAHSHAPSHSRPSPAQGGGGQSGSRPTFHRGYPKPDNAKPGHFKKPHRKGGSGAGQASAAHASSGHASTGHASAGHTKPAHAKSGHSKPTFAKAGHGKPGHPPRGQGGPSRGPRNQRPR